MVRRATEFQLFCRLSRMFGSAWHLVVKKGRVDIWSRKIWIFWFLWTILLVSIWIGWRSLEHLFGKYRKWHWNDYMRENVAFELPYDSSLFLIHCYPSSLDTFDINIFPLPLGRGLLAIRVAFISTCLRISCEGFVWLRASGIYRFTLPIQFSTCNI